MTGTWHFLSFLSWLLLLLGILLGLRFGPCLFQLLTKFSRPQQLQTRLMLLKRGFPGSLAVKNLRASAGDVGSIPGLERFLGGGNRNPLQYSYLENSMVRGTWWATDHGVPRASDTTVTKQEWKLISDTEYLYLHQVERSWLLY